MVLDAGQHLCAPFYHCTRCSGKPTGMCDDVAGDVNGSHLQLQSLLQVMAAGPAVGRARNILQRLAAVEVC